MVAMRDKRSDAPGFSWIAERARMRHQTTRGGRISGHLAPTRWSKGTAFVFRSQRPRSVARQGTSRCSVLGLILSVQRWSIQMHRYKSAPGIFFLCHLRPGTLCLEAPAGNDTLIKINLTNQSPSTDIVNFEKVDVATNHY